MSKDRIAGGAVLGALIIVIMGLIVGVILKLPYSVNPWEIKKFTFALSIAYYNLFPVNVYISIFICIFAGLCAGVVAKGPMSALIAGIGAYIGSIIGLLIVSAMNSAIFAPMFGIGAFTMADLGLVVAHSFIWGIWCVIGMAFLGGILNKEGEWRG